MTVTGGRRHGSGQRDRPGRSVVIAGGVASVGLVAPTPAAAASGPDLQVRIDVTPAKATYAVGDAITTTFVVTNAGTSPT